MPVDIVLDSLDSVDDSEKQFFVETDGKFKFDWAKRDEAVKKPLLSKNSELKREKDRLKALEKFKDFSDDDLTAYQEWKAAQGDDDDSDGSGANGDGKKADAVDAKKLAKQIKAEIKKEYDAALKLKDDELAKERTRFDQYQFELKLAEVADAAGVVRMKQFKALNALDKQFGWKDGKLIALDPDGEESTDSVDERFKALFQHADWQNLFAAKEAGGGSGEHKGKTPGRKALKRSEMSNKEKSDYIKDNGGGEKGMDAYLSLPLK